MSSDIAEIENITMKSFHNLQANPGVVAEFLKCAQRFVQLAHSATTLESAIHEEIGITSNLHSGDLGDGMKILADIMGDVADQNRKSLAQLATNLDSLKSTQAADQKLIQEFEKNYAKQKNALKNEIQRLENNTKKAGKIATPQALESQINALNGKVKEADSFRKQSMKDILLIERQKNLSFFQLWNEMMTVDAELFQNLNNSIKLSFEEFRSLCSTKDDLEENYAEILQDQKRTLIEIEQKGNRHSTVFGTGEKPNVAPPGFSQASLSPAGRGTPLNNAGRGTSTPNPPSVGRGIPSAGRGGDRPPAPPSVSGVPPPNPNPSYNNTYENSYENNNFENNTYENTYDNTYDNTFENTYDNNNYENNYQQDSYQNSYQNSYQDNYQEETQQNYPQQTCTALYDYPGEEEEDLTFYFGEIITILKMDDGSGWMEGSKDGRIGIFPSSYVEINF